MPAELLPCPCCGDILIEIKGSVRDWYTHKNKSLSVCLLANICVFPDEFDLWNKRANIKEEK